MHTFRILSSTLKQSIYNQLEAEPQKQSRLSATNWALLFLILLSLVLYTAETEEEIGLKEFGFLWFLNVAILIAFGIEFALRQYVVSVNKKYIGWEGLRKYARDNWFMVTVDFLAFAPELFVITIGLTPPSWLRVLRVARLFKIARYFPAFKLVAAAVRSCIQELLAALAVAVMLWYLASVLLYLAEGEAQPDRFGSITRSMWWSVVTLTTVGYGDVHPITVLGKILAGFVAVLGIGAVALPSGILAGAFMEKLRHKRTTD